MVTTGSAFSREHPYEVVPLTSGLDLGDRSIGTRLPLLIVEYDAYILFAVISRKDTDLRYDFLPKVNDWARDGIRGRLTGSGGDVMLALLLGFPDVSAEIN